MTKQDSQEAFEQWFVDQKYLIPGARQIADEAWQAAIAYATAQQAELKKLPKPRAVERPSDQRVTLLFNSTAEASRFETAFNAQEQGR